MLIFVVEQIASLNEQIEHADINLFVRPLAFAEDGGVFIGFANNIDLGQGLRFRIVAPTASKRAELINCLI